MINLLHKMNNKTNNKTNGNLKEHKTKKIIMIVVLMKLKVVLRILMFNL